MTSHQRILIHALRHPDVGAEHRETFLGHSDIPLSERGREEAREIARGLASRIDADKLGVVHTSDLLRCATLADVIAEELGCETRPDARLRGQHLGDWTGKTASEIKSGPREPLVELHFDSASWQPPGGGESLIDVAKRCFSWYAEAVRETTGPDLVVVAHASTLRALIAKVIGLPFDNAIRIAPAPGTYALLQADEHGTGNLVALGSHP